MPTKSEERPLPILWGQRDRYYAGMEASDGVVWSEEVTRWEQMVSKLMPDAKARVERAVKTWNNKIRDHLRDEMGFRLSNGEKQISVPVSVTNGMPILLLRQLDEADAAWAELLIRRRLFLDTEKGVVETREMLGLISHVLQRQTLYPRESASLETIAALIGELNAALKSKQLPDRILRLDQDVLGAYYFHVPRVQIFWLPIALLAISDGMPIEELTFVVLAHELAHAYTHLGFDIDGEAWDTGDFARSELELVEGLAQYYTAVVCGKMKERLPVALECFKRMLEKQPAVYKAFRDWDQSDSGELMRAFLRQVSGRNSPRPVMADDNDLW